MEEKKVKELEQELSRIDKRRKEITKEISDLKDRIAVKKYKNMIGE